jgi:CubicO group peptidase (beta-lactamase class C family)
MAILAVPDKTIFVFPLIFGTLFVTVAVGNVNPTIDHLFADFSLAGVPGASLMVIEDGKICLAASYGLANLASGTDCATETNYRLASVTKQFTAMSILILAERGKLSLDDRLPKFFPGYPAHGKDITLRHLLTHTSGLLAYEDLIPPSATVQVKDKDVLELLRQQDKTMFPPGTAFHYSNTGYAFLALVVAEVSGVPFAKFLRENIFQPLGMNNTVAFEAGISTVPHRALGYVAEISGDKTRRAFVLADQSMTSAVLGDGGIYSSTADLFKWDQALYTEQLVRREILQQAFTASSRTSDAANSGYGFGWYVGSHRGVSCVWHYGGTCGFSTHIERYPQKKLSLIVLANRRSAPLAEISRAIIDLYWT